MDEGDRRPWVLKVKQVFFDLRADNTKRKRGTGTREREKKRTSTQQCLYFLLGNFGAIEVIKVFRLNADIVILQRQEEMALSVGQQRGVINKKSTQWKGRLGRLMRHFFVVLKTAIWPDRSVPRSTHPATSACLKELKSQQLTLPRANIKPEEVQVIKPKRYRSHFRR